MQEHQWDYLTRKPTQAGTSKKVSIRSLSSNSLLKARKKSIIETTLLLTTILFSHPLLFTSPAASSPPVALATCLSRKPLPVITFPSRIPGVTSSAVILRIDPTIPLLQPVRVRLLRCYRTFDEELYLDIRGGNGDRGVGNMYVTEGLIAEGRPYCTLSPFWGLRGRRSLWIIDVVGCGNIILHQ